MATVLSCSDQSLPPEIIFGQGSGDLFVVRVSDGGSESGGAREPGVFGRTTRLASFGRHGSHVMRRRKSGHDDSGVPGAKSPGVNMQSLLNFIRPALQRPQERADPWTSAVYASVEQTVNDIVQHSLVIGELARAGEITLVGAVYQADSGKVAFSRPVQFSETQDRSASVAGARRKIAPMKLYFSILILATVPILAQNQPVQKAPPAKEAVKPNPPVSPRTRHPFGRPALPASAKTEYAKPSVCPASSRPPVVWEKSWASPVTVEWEDAPARVPPATQAADQPANLAGDINAIKKQLDELTQMVRARAAAQGTETEIYFSSIINKGKALAADHFFGMGTWSRGWNFRLKAGKLISLIVLLPSGVVDFSAPLSEIPHSTTCLYR